MKQLQLTCLIFVILVTIFSCTKKKNNRSPSIFEDLNTEVELDKNGNPAVVKAKDIKIDFNFFKENRDRIRIPLFEEKYIDIEKLKDSEVDRIGANYRVLQDPNGRVIVSEVNGKYAIDIILSKGEIYQIRFLKEGIYQIRQIDQTKYRPEGGSTPVTSNSSGDPLPCANTDPADQIDVMVLYTDDVMDAVGDRDAIEAEIYLAVYETNLGYQNSNVNQRIEIVHIAEVEYDQSADIQTDLARLQNPSDGFIDNIHALRDAHAADLVCLIKENDPEWCGWAYTMTTVSDAFEDDAFSVVSRSCATGNYSFGHELGHNMGALHDCFVDDDLDPYDYAHGFVELSPSDAATGRWRTIMAYNSECGDDDPCTRVLQWSNPNVDYPLTGTADPTGTSAGMCKADNRLTLNNTASVVANFRCRSRGPNNVWMKDTWSDTGAEPDPATAGEAMYRSPYIWIRNDQDVNNNFQHQHQNPQMGSTNYVYVKMLNGGNSTSGNMELYYANASTSLTWSSAWTLIESKPVNINANTSEILEYEWSSLPGEGHYCLVARWVSASDPMATPEGTSIGDNTRNNNNIVWRNVNIVPMGGGDQYTASMNFEAERSIIRFQFDENENPFQFIPHAGSVFIQFDNKTNALIEEGLIQLVGMEKNNKRYQIASVKDCSMKILKVPRKYKGDMKLTFTSKKNSPKRTYFLNIAQQFNKRKESEGVVYEINLEDIK